MVRIVHAVCASFVLSSLVATSGQAQVAGRVTGTVADAESGVPLAGAQISVVASRFGNVTNENGRYFINRVPAGSHTISAQYLGYRTITSQVRVLAGQTATVDFTLPPEAVGVAPIVALTEVEPLLVRDDTVSKARILGKRVRSLPIDRIEQVVILGAGVYAARDNPVPAALISRSVASGIPSVGDRAGNGDFVVRGGRPTEVATYIDGVLVTDLATLTTRTQTGVFAVEEVDVITGGFSAEFGNAQSGIVNIVTREGGSSHSGVLRFKTDGRFGTDGYDEEERQAFAREKCCGFHQIAASLGGPIIPNRVSYFTSLDLIGSADISPRVAGFNPAEGAFNDNGSTETILPGNSGDRLRYQAKLALFPSHGSKVTATYLFSRDQLEEFTHGFWVAQPLSRAIRTKTHDLIIGIDLPIVQRADRNIGIQLRASHRRSSRVQGVPRSPEVVSELRQALGDACGVECEVDERTFEPDFLNFRFHDIEFFFEDSTALSIVKLPFRRRDLDPIFGRRGCCVTGGLSRIFSRDLERSAAVRAELDAQVNRIHRTKVGGEWQWIDLFRDAGVLDGFFDAERYDVDPSVASMYVQHRMDYGDLVIDLGVRWDRWDPNAIFPVLPGVVNCAHTLLPATGCDADAAVVDAPTRTALAPRLGVAHPVTDRTQVRLSYGVFHQLPELQDFYLNHTSDSDLTFERAFGNPNLDYIETTALEAGITHLLTDDLVLDVASYNRDRRGATRFQSVPPGTLSRRQEEFFTIVNGDNGNVKGVDVTLSKRFSSLFSADLAWTLQWARGTTSSPTDFIAHGFGILFDPLFPGRRLAPPTSLSPESFDRLHTINAQFNLRLPADFRRGTALGRLFQGSGVYAVYNGSSGTPFTRVDPVSFFPIEDLGSSRLPWVHQLDLRFTREIHLDERKAVEVFAEMRNALAFENVFNVDPFTGLPDRSFSTGRFEPRIPVDVKLPGAPSGFPLPVDMIVPEAREIIGRQDLNGDGLITLEEAREVSLQADIAGINSALQYGEPRQVRFGVEYRF